MSMQPVTPAAVQTSPNAPAPRVQRLRIACVVVTLALVLLALMWELVWARTGTGLLAIKALPAALALPGLLKHRMFTYRWLSLAVWLYALEGLVRGPSDRGLSATLAWLEVALACALFVAVTVYIRLRLKLAKEQAAQSSAAHANRAGQQAPAQNA